MKLKNALFVFLFSVLFLLQTSYSCSTSQMLNVVLFGASGATGKAFVDILVGGSHAANYVNHSSALAADTVAPVGGRHLTAVTRKEMRWPVIENPAHPFGTWELENHVMDYENMEETLAPKLVELQKKHGMIDVVFCAHGTTIKQAGSEEAFIHIDKEMVVEMARKAKAAGIKHFSLVSSAMADPQSSLLYTKTKGQTIEEIKALGFERFSVFKPGLLITNARTDSRFMESVAQGMAPFTDWISKATGWESLKPLQSITVEDLAASMIANAMRPSPTTDGYEEYDTSPDIISLQHKAKL